MTIILAVALAAVALACAVVIFLCRKYVRDTYNAIGRVLDRAMQQDRALLTETTGEDRLSKLAYKAHRLVETGQLKLAQVGEEKDTVQSFIADMSHQMKTPLAAIYMYTDLLLEGDLSQAEAGEFLLRMKAATEKLRWMMDGLIKVSRLETGAIQLAPVAASIGATIHEAVKGVLAAAGQRGIDIVVDDFEDTALLHDRKWTREALSNILENAVKYSREGGTIGVAVERLPLYTKVSVTNHGIGIPKEDWHLIFKRFYRGQNVKDYEGAGLGLYLAALVMEKQGGYVMVDSKVGEFTTFSVFFANTETSAHGMNCN